MTTTYFADRIAPPPKTDSFTEQYRWNYRVFELLNGILTLPGYAVDPDPTHLLFSDEATSTSHSIHVRLTRLEKAVALMNSPDLNEIRRELDELKNMISVEV